MITIMVLKKSTTYLLQFFYDFTAMLHVKHFFFFLMWALPLTDDINFEAKVKVNLNVFLGLTVVCTG